MKTIEIKTGEQTAQFTTKSVTFDGKEFFYSKMQNVKHNPSGCIYAFTYDGELKMLPYEAKDAKVLAAIFSQVQKLPPHKQASAEAPADPAQKASAAPSIKDVMEHDKEEAASENVSAPVTEAEETAAPVAEAEETAPASETAEDEAADAEAEETPQEPVVFEDKKAAKQAEKARKKAEREAKKAEKAAQKAAKANLDPSQEGTEENADDPEKKTKMKKSLIIFAAIIGITAILAVAFYFIFGTSTNPSVGPNSTESQQYDDIDELINDLQ